MPNSDADIQAAIEAKLQAAIAFRAFAKGYGGTIPVATLIDHQRIRDAFFYLHKGWLRTTIAADGASVLLVRTENGKQLVALAEQHEEKV